MSRYHNPFAGIDLIAPIEYRDDYDHYCQRSGRTVVDQSPFPRMVDFWFASLSLATRKGLRPADLSKQQTFKFIDGSILDRDSWRVQTIMLIAIAIEDKVEILDEPRRIMALANGLAAAGIPELKTMLDEGGQDPIWNLSDALSEVLQS